MILLVINSFLTYFGHLYAHRQEVRLTMGVKTPETFELEVFHPEVFVK